MTALCGRLEAQLTLTSVSQDFVNAAGTTTVSFNGTYFLSELIASLVSQLGAGWSVAWSNGEGVLSAVTGRVTIDSATHHPFHVTWFGSGTYLQAALGYSANIAATSSPAVADRHVVGAWNPCVAKFTRHGDYDRGAPLTDFRQTVSPTGAVYTLKSNSYDVWDGLRWDAVAGQRAKRNLEAVHDESFEAFFRNCQLGESALCLPGAPVRLYYDANSTTYYIQGTFLHAGTFDPDPKVPGWTGLYPIVLPRMVVASTSVP